METETQEFEKVGTNADELRAKAEHWVKDKPSDAILTAAGIGFLVALLPMGKILRAILGLTFSLLKPTLLVLGLLKVVEEVQANCSSCHSDESSGDHP